MSASPENGLWIEHTCDGNRRLGVQKLAQQGIAISAADLNEEQAFECNYAGAEAVQGIIEVARDEAVGLLALWVWSTNNWGRSEAQQKAVFRVMHAYLQNLENDWMYRPENKDVRLLHMGQTEQLWIHAPDVMSTMTRIINATQDRTGMAIALLMDYTGPDELERALLSWQQSGCMGNWKDHLDLPKQGIAYRELDLRIRTGDGDSDIKHINGVMNAYAGLETREVFPPVLLAEYTPDMFRQHLKELRNGRKNKGK